MKKLLLSLIFMFACLCMSVSAIDVTIDGAKQTYDVMPVNINGRVLVPLRGIFEALGAEIEWRDDIKTVTATKGAKEVIVTIDSFAARIDGQPVTLDVAPTIIEGRTMVPVRFVSEAMGENVDWDDATKTVIITDNPNSGLKRLVSDYHRNVPTEFTKSSELCDLIYYEQKDPDDVFAALPSAPVVLFDFDEFNNSRITNRYFANGEMVKGDDGKDVYRIDVRATSDTATDSMLKFDTKLDTSLFGNSDCCLVKMTLRTTAGGDENGKCKIFLQVEHPTTYEKDVERYISVGNEWTTYYYSYQPKMKDGGRTSVAIRLPYYKQSIEIKDFEILNYRNTVDFADMPQTSEDMSRFAEGAEWREQALKDIEQYRKGDFTVVVTDKNGNPLEDAEVELDMFEHEFEFGSAFRDTEFDGGKYSRIASSVFNAGVDENTMKWRQYEIDGAKRAETLLARATKLGIKYFRGHALVWQIVNDDGTSKNIPEDAWVLAACGNTEELRERINGHIAEEMAQFCGRLTEWDVINEIIRHKKLEANNGGVTLRKEWFDEARKAEPGVDLFYNEAALYIERIYPEYTAEFFRLLDEMEAAGVDYDGIGLQGHHDKAQETMEEHLALFDRVAKYGKEVKITEYSCGVSDPILQANYTRDYFIAAFSKPYITGIIMWGFWDGANYEKYSPMYNVDWTLKPAGEQIVDLIYNKWWTRDAKAVTDKDGIATVRGFYGDYDVTVKVGDKEVKTCVAFGQGYENTLYITVE